MTPALDAPATGTAESPSSLSPARLIFGDLERELHSTRRTLERFPDGKGDWRPHEKSMALGRLATHVADMPTRGLMILGSDEMDIMARPPLTVLGSAAELLAFFDRNAAELLEVIAAADYAGLERPWTIRRGTQVLLTGPKRDLLRNVMMNHLVHHRAQLGVYYRLLGIPVPGLYGPSADEM